MPNSIHMFHAQNGAVSRDMELILNPGVLEFPAAGGTQRITVLTTAPADELEITIQGAGFSRSVSGYDIFVTAQNLGANVQKAKYATITVKYRDTTVSATISQEANFIESLKIGGGSTSEYLPATLTYSAAGGSNPFTGWAVYTSGAQACITTWNSGDWTVSDPSFTKSLANGILTVSGEYRGTTAGAERKAALTVNLTSAATDNKPLKAVLNLTQEANEATCVYGDIQIGNFSYPEIPAAGGTVPPTLVYSQPARNVYSSGGEKQLAPISSGATLRFEKEAGTGTVDPSSGTVTAATRGTTIDAANTLPATVRVHVLLNGKETSDSVNAIQQRNVVSQIKAYQNAAGDIPFEQNFVAGGDRHFITARATYTSRYAGEARFLTDSDWSVSGVGFSFESSESYPWAGVVVAENRGSVEGAARNGTVTVSYEGLIDTIKLTQDENRIEAYSDYRLDAPAVELGYRTQSYADVTVGCSATARYSSGDSQSGAQIPVACNFPDVPVLSFTDYSGPGGAAGQTYYKVTALSTNSSSAPYEFEVQMVYHPDSGEDVVLGIQRIVQAAAAAVGPGTLQLQTSIGTFPRTGYYLVFRFGAADIAAASVSVDKASQRITVPENTVSELVAGGAGAPGDIDIFLFESAGSSAPVHTGRITQGQLGELKNGTDILITVG